MITYNSLGVASFSENKEELLLTEILAVQFKLCGGMRALNKEDSRLDREAFKNSRINKIYNKLVNSCEHCLDHDSNLAVARKICVGFDY